jgi:hypothetical protein
VVSGHEVAEDDLPGVRRQLVGFALGQRRHLGRADRIVRLVGARGGDQQREGRGRGRVIIVELRS